MPRSKLIHILGGGRYQVPTVHVAKKMGHRVLVTDMYAQRPAYAFADLHEVVDIRDAEGTLAAARKHDIDGIVCDTTDVGVPVMAWVAEQLGLPGISHETALNFTDKLHMREKTSAAGVPGPAFRAIRGFADLVRAVDEIGLPLVIKPSDSQGSRGVRVLRERANLERWLADALRHASGQVVLAEAFLPGIEVTVEGIVIAGRAFVVGISDKGHYAHRPEVANRLTYPADLPPHVLRHIGRVNDEVVRALGMVDGITHAEYFVDGEDVFLVEIAARGGGSHVYSHIVPWLAGVDVPGMYVEYLLGGRMGPPPDGVQRAANLQFLDFPLGRITAIHGLEEARALPGVQVVSLDFAPGDVLRPPSEDSDRHGQVLVFGATRDEVLATTRRVFETVRVDVET